MIKNNLYKILTGSIIKMDKNRFDRFVPTSDDKYKRLSYTKT